MLAVFYIENVCVLSFFIIVFVFFCSGRFYLELFNCWDILKMLSFVWFCLWRKKIHWTWNWINFIIKCLLCDTKNIKYKMIPNQARRSFQCLVSILINRCRCFDKYLHSTRFLNVFVFKILHFCCNVSFCLFGINKLIESTQAYSVKKIANRNPTIEFIFIRNKHNYWFTQLTNGIEITPVTTVTGTNLGLVGILCGWASVQRIARAKHESVNIYAQIYLFFLIY